MGWTLLSIAGSGLCCLVMVAVVVGAVMLMRRQSRSFDQFANESTHEPAPARNEPALPPRPAPAAKKAEPAAPPPAYRPPPPRTSPPDSPDELATVFAPPGLAPIAPPPPRPAALPRPGDAPDAGFGKAAPRASGQTIIAFEDDLDDEDGKA